MHRKILVIGLIAFQFPVYAQEMSSVAIGNFSGVSALYLNPASTALSPFKWHINTAVVGFDVHTNFLQLALPYSPYELMDGKPPAAFQTENGNPLWKDEWIQETPTDKKLNASVSGFIYGPSIGFRAGKFSFAIVSGGLVTAHMFGMSGNLSHAILNGMDSSKGAYSHFTKPYEALPNTISATTIAAGGYAYAGLNANLYHQLDNQRRLAFGITVKRLIGAGTAYLKWDEFELSVIDTNSYQLTPTHFEYASSANRGTGMGLDAGLVYLFHKKGNKREYGYSVRHPDYFARLSVSVLDLGFVTYANADVIQLHIPGNRIYTISDSERESISNGILTYSMFDSIMSDDDMYTRKTENIRIGAPMRISTSADLQIRKHLFLSAIWTQSLRSRRNHHMRIPSYVMFSPRYERTFFQFSLPLFLENDYSSLRLGASIRLGPVFFGTNSIRSFVYTGNIKDADAFLGIAFGNLEGKFSDRLVKLKRRKFRTCPLF